MEYDRQKQMVGLVIDMLCNCKFDKKGRLIMDATKAQNYLEYLKSLYYTESKKTLL